MSFQQDANQCPPESDKEHVSFPLSRRCRKRKFLGSEESSDDGLISDCATLSLAHSAQEAENDLKDDGMPLVSSCSSESCDQSMTSSSNTSALALLDGFVDPNDSSTHLKVNFDHHDHYDETRRSSNENKKIDGQENDSILCTSSHSLQRNSKVKDMLFASRRESFCNEWDDSSWDLPIPSCLPDRRKQKTPGMNSIASPMRRGQPKIKRVHNVMYAKGNDLNSEDPTWDDTSWSLRILSSAETKQKALGNAANVAGKDTSCLKGGCFCQWNDEREKMNPKNADSAEGKLRESDDSGHRLHLKLFPIDLHRKAIPSASKLLDTRQSPSSDFSYVLYRWLRSRLKAGIIHSSFNVLHQMLEKFYEEATHVIRKLEKGSSQNEEISSLFNLRDRVAGIWCVYAHFFLEVGYLVISQERKKPNDYTETTISNVFHHAISILSKARDCPLAGSHTAIMVSMARLIVSSSIVTEKDACNCMHKELSRGVLLRKIRSSIDSCWDSIDICQRKSQTKRRFSTQSTSISTRIVLSSFESKCENLQAEEGIPKATVEEGIQSVLSLPSNLRNSCSSNVLSSIALASKDKDAIPFLCMELNRLSRLQEAIEDKSQRVIRLAPSRDLETLFAAEELPLFAAVESLSDPINLYGGEDTSGEGVIWHW